MKRASLVQSLGAGGIFLTVRHWWGRGPGKVTTRLFVFELLVVVAGVLIAQALAELVQDRADFAKMQTEHSRVRYELSSVHNAFRTWDVALPCLNQRMTEVMRAVPPQIAGSLRRPRFPTPNVAMPSTEVLDLIGRRYGAEEKNRLNWIAENTKNASPVISAIISKWGRLGLIDPENGTVSPTDRVEARLAAADIKAQLRGMEVLSRDTSRVLSKMKIVSRNLTDPDFGPARSCAAIWKSGRLDPPVTGS